MLSKVQQFVILSEQILIPSYEYLLFINVKHQHYATTLFVLTLAEMLFGGRIQVVMQENPFVELFKF